MGHTLKSLKLIKILLRILTKFECSLAKSNTFKITNCGSNLNVENLVWYTQEFLCRNCHNSNKKIATLLNFVKLISKFEVSAISIQKCKRTKLHKKYTTDQKTHTNIRD